MGRVQDTFAGLRAGRACGLAPFVCAGRPVADGWARLLPALERGGASVIEIGMPFSDPIADGPVIAQAMHHALEAGVTPARVFADIASVRGEVSIPLVLMVSVSLVTAGDDPDGFIRRAREAGVDGLIVPDAPIEEIGAIRSACTGAGLTLSLLVAPDSDEARVRTITSNCDGFVYLLSRRGITGTGGPGEAVAASARAIRAACDLPIACGFGIKTAEDVRVVGEHVEAAIVGTALVEHLDRAHAEGRDLEIEAETFAVSLMGQPQT